MDRVEQNISLAENASSNRDVLGDNCLKDIAQKRAQGKMGQKLCTNDRNHMSR